MRFHGQNHLTRADVPLDGILEALKRKRFPIPPESSKAEEAAIEVRESTDTPTVQRAHHLLEPTHNARFQSLMDQHLPKWRSHRDTLNRLAVRHGSRGY